MCRGVAEGGAEAGLAAGVEGWRVSGGRQTQIDGVAKFNCNYTVANKVVSYLGRKA